MIRDLEIEQKVIYILEDIRSGLYKKTDLKASYEKHFDSDSHYQFKKALKEAFSRWIAQREKSELMKRELYDVLERQALEEKIKTKLQRESEIEVAKQKAIDMLENMEKSETVLVKGQPKRFTAALTPQDIGTLCNAIVRMDAELSQMRGDYAPKEINQNTTLLGAEGEGVVVKIVDDNGNIID